MTLAMGGRHSAGMQRPFRKIPKVAFFFLTPSVAGVKFQEFLDGVLDS